MPWVKTCRARYPKTFRYLGGGIVLVARFHLAGLFILSGLAKGVNPFGFSLKLGEYFGALGLDFLEPLAAVGGIVLPALELFIGFMLLWGISRRVAAWGALLFLGFFTGLTLWVAVADPVSDCGCFGDILKVSNWATFIKNILFLLWALIYFAARERERAKNPSTRWTAVVYAIFVPLSLLPGVYAWCHLPLIDPSPFRVGVNIPQAMQAVPSGGETTLIYRSLEDGREREFTLSDTTWYDNTKWEYVDTKTQGQHAAPAITGLPMFDGAGDDHSDRVLHDPGYTLLFIVNDRRDNPQLLERAIVTTIDYIHGQGGRVVVLSATPLPKSRDALLLRNIPEVEFLQSDPTTLRTAMPQAVGGALLLHGGTIVGKWDLAVFIPQFYYLCAI